MVESDRFLELASGADVRALVSLLMPLLGGVVVLLGDVVVELLGGVVVVVLDGDVVVVVVVVVLDGDVLLMPLVDEVSLAVPVTSPVEVDVPLLLYELDRSLCTRMRVDDVVVVSVVVWAAATCAPAVAIKAAALMASGTMKRCCMQTSPGESSQSSPIRHHCAGVGPAVERSGRNRRRGSAPPRRTDACCALHHTGRELESCGRPLRGPASLLHGRGGVIGEAGVGG